jgi:hypothetical protein
LLTAIVEALRSAGATEEISAAAVKAGGALAIGATSGHRVDMALADVDEAEPGGPQLAEVSVLQRKSSLRPSRRLGHLRMPHRPEGAAAFEISARSTLGATWGIAHDVPRLALAIVEALRSAGATEEIIAAVVGAAGAFQDAPSSRGGRPRNYADRALRDRAYRERKKARDETPVPDAPRDETRDETPFARYEMCYEIPRLRARLEEAGEGHFDPDADISPIIDLLDQGCDLEAEVVPIRRP